MTEENNSKSSLDKIAKKLGGKWYSQIVSDGRKEFKRIVIEYSHKKVN